MFAVSSQAIDAGSNNKMSSKLLGRAEQLVNIALAITYMNAAIGFTKKRARLTQIFQPANAFLRLNRDSCRIGFV